MTTYCWGNPNATDVLPALARDSWRTFLANHFGELAFASTVTLSDAPGDHDVADACVYRFVPLRLHATGGRSHCRAVGVRRLAFLASTPASWRASCPASRAPQFTSHWQGP